MICSKISKEGKKPLRPLNYHLFKKFKLIRRSKFNYLINTLINIFYKILKFDNLIYLVVLGGFMLRSRSPYPYCFLNRKSFLIIQICSCKIFIIMNTTVHTLPWQTIQVQ
jgi:predicted membrane protein